MYYTIYLADCVDGDVRLEDGTDPSNGCVEVCQSGMWTSVCSSQFDQNDASVVCRQLRHVNSEGIVIIICASTCACCNVRMAVLKKQVLYEARQRDDGIQQLYNLSTSC